MLIRLTFLCLACVCFSPIAFGQAGMRASLERLDTNENGLIDPNEVTTLSRPFLERIAKQRRLRLDRPVAISDYLIAARIYYAVKNGSSGEDVRPISDGTVKGFGPDRNEILVPGFGAEIKYTYTERDVNEAERTLRRSDWNRDGFIDRREARQADWTHRNPFEDDLNDDQKLSKLELIQRYARRRQLEEANGELIRKAARTGGEIKDSRVRTKTTKESSEKWWQQGGKSHWLTAAMMGRFDADKNGRLTETEARKIGIPMSAIDLDRNGEISKEELFQYIAPLQDEAGDESLGLPGWFFELDTNRDGQLSMAEFAVEPTVARREEFWNLDANADGLLTATEVLESDSVTGGVFRNDEGTLLTPKRTMISEIEIEEDVWIRHLKVQIQITHTSVSQLDVFLAGPDGERVELFTEIGGGGKHFDGMILDDNAPTPAIKARPPFNGSYQPEALKAGKPGLLQWKDKSAKGTWQLIVRATRSDRFGMLHEWNLQIEPLEDIPQITEDPEEQPTEETSEGDPSEADKDATDSSPKPKQDQPAQNPILKILGGGLVPN